MHLEENRRWVPLTAYPRALHLSLQRVNFKKPFVSTIFKMRVCANRFNLICSLAFFIFGGGYLCMFHTVLNFECSICAKFAVK